MSSVKVDNIKHRLSTDDSVSLASDSSVALKHSGNQKLVTSSTGVSVTGTCAATAFSGDGSNLTNIALPSTLTGSANLSGLLREGVNITAGKLSDNTNIDLANGMVHLFTTTETTTSTPNIRFNSSTSLDSSMSVGEAISVNIITTAAAAAYSAQLTIDGAAVTENWVGGAAPSDGGSSGVDIYSYTIIKTASATFTVIGNQSKTS
tara:strand:- start:2489 stop:3106 length:618 start_codon:yes stop_codon:yes gene_type:complete